MDIGVLVVVFIRTLVPILILRFSLLGGILSIVADYFDLNILQIFHSDLNHYQTLDKTLDMYYLAIEAYTAYFWTNLLAKKAAILLFGYRLMGFILFLIFGQGFILVLFPNVFEFFYLFYLGFKKLHKFDPVTSLRKLLIILFLLLIPKVIHEYFLHVNTTYPWTENKYVKFLFK